VYTAVVSYRDMARLTVLRGSSDENDADDLLEEDDDGGGGGVGVVGLLRLLPILLRNTIGSWRRDNVRCSF
jgi:hypothetical protein